MTGYQSLSVCDWICENRPPCKRMYISYIMVKFDSHSVLPFVHYSVKHSAYSSTLL